MPARLSVSSWSLHRALGPVYWDKPEDPRHEPTMPYGPGSITLLELPAKIAAMGIHTLEICHFHLISRDEVYLSKVRDALDDAGVQLFSLLIDDGDITHPEHAERDLEWIEGWLETAGILGAERARVIAGKTTGEWALERSYFGLNHLADVAKAHNVRLMTENWFGVFDTPEAVHEVMGKLDGRAGLCLDFGNWSGENKYDALASIAPYAESCHAKCSFDPPLSPDREDYERCLDITSQASFDGPYTLIYDGPDDHEWAGLKLEVEMVAPYLEAN